MLPWRASKKIRADASLRLPYLRPSAGLDDTAIEHVLALFDRVKTLSAPIETNPDALGARAANARVRIEMREADNYFADIEKAAASALRAAGYSGPGAVSERLLTDITAHYGFEIALGDGHADVDEIDL